MARSNRKPEVDYAAAAKRWAESNSSGRKPTMQDVAHLAGVSKKTISRIINDSPSVNEVTRRGIQQLIREIGYRPDPQARGLASKRSFLVGLITDNPTPQYVVNIQHGILDVLRQTGYELVVHPCDRKSDSFLEDAKRFIEVQKLYGVILTPSVSEDERLAEELRELGCAYIRIASIALDMESRMIVTNDREGGKAAARHLAKLGHTRIACVTGRRSFRSSTERIAGFEEGLAEHGLSVLPEYMLGGDYTFESGLALGADLLDLDPPPTAVFAANDEMAAGILQALHVAGRTPPDSLSVVGFDDFETATRVWPRLTTARTPARKIGRLAAERLFEFYDGDREIVAENETIPELVERDSTRRPSH
ncbi:LacI family DNA-binding transcriptional regulator [Congregibacter brevis]|uniref:LacI family DNA-binding transcriptional regulator n=1 Tax=Congregibacter brevis TaxID=3081201 RepID=A0ABZ0IFP4_9GAMM|nr:LacI family DNA-binding transcriptional regulator [Congregibacter sp. IMCC45268]